MQLFLNLVEFALDPKLKEYIKENKESFAAKCASMDLDHLEYQTFTKKFLKEKGVSPDAMLQFAIQVKPYKLRKGYLNTLNPVVLRTPKTL